LEPLEPLEPLDVFFGVIEGRGVLGLLVGCVAVVIMTMNGGFTCKIVTIGGCHRPPVESLLIPFGLYRCSATESNIPMTTRPHSCIP